MALESHGLVQQVAAKGSVSFPNHIHLCSTDPDLRQGHRWIHAHLHGNLLTFSSNRWRCTAQIFMLREQRERRFMKKRSSWPCSWRFCWKRTMILRMEAGKIKQEEMWQTGRCSQRSAVEPMSSFASEKLSLHLICFVFHIAQLRAKLTEACRNLANSLALK